VRAIHLDGAHGRPRPQAENAEHWPAPATSTTASKSIRWQHADVPPDIAAPRRCSQHIERRATIRAARFSPHVASTPPRFSEFSAWLRLCAVDQRDVGESLGKIPEQALSRRVIFFR
jgi:hypothetical protein